MRTFHKVLLLFFSPLLILCINIHPVRSKTIFVLCKISLGTQEMQENRITSVTASSSSETSPTGNEKGSDITSNTNTSTSNANDIDQAQFEADKRAVYK